MLSLHNVGLASVFSKSVVGALAAVMFSRCTSKHRVKPWMGSRQEDFTLKVKTSALIVDLITGIIRKKIKS